MDLSCDLGFLRLKNPLIAASGCYGYGTEYGSLCSPSSLGAFVTKGITLEPRSGNPPPRIWETPQGLLNSIGLQNPGVDVVIAKILPPLKSKGCPVIVNINGRTVEEYRLLAKKLNESDVPAALEVNISCPNVKEGGVTFGQDPRAAARVVRAVVRASRFPIITKLSPNVTDIAVMARAVEDAGSHGISLINTFFGMAIDLKTLRAGLGATHGGVSGPAVKPMAVYLAAQVLDTVKIPVIGMGGISTASDAAEFLALGCKALQVGSILFRDPSAPKKILKGLPAILKKHGVSSIRKFTGIYNQKRSSGQKTRGRAKTRSK